METVEIKSYQNLIENINNNEKSFALLYKKESEQSECALSNFNKAASENKEVGKYTVNVAKVRDIHGEFSIKSVPVLLYFEKSEFKNVIKGCNDASFYLNLFNENLYSSKTTNSDEKKQPKVILYSTPSCSWCTRIKNYFKEQNIKFRNIDVSKDEKAAAEMVKRSGQQGVPQTLIGGKIIVGFDKNKIDNLLGIRS